MARYDDLDTKFIAFATLISCLLLVAVLQGTQALCYNMTNVEEARKLDASEYHSSTAVLTEQRKSLNVYEKVAVPPALGSDGKPVVGGPTSRLQIPLERATELLLQEAKEGKSKAKVGT
ncbi:MAG: hypothetical protein SGI77_00440 [Pirellulaceae bacterium]|nr:hypothetical protein [Pirellulaceae bacterium]